MSIQMATPLLPLPLSAEKEQEIVNDIHLADKPLYIRSKESEVHVGTKIVFEIRSEDDIEKLHPLVKSLGLSSSDSSSKNLITEVRQKHSPGNKSTLVTDSKDVEKTNIKDSQKSESITGISDLERSESTLVADSATPSEDMAFPNRQENSSLLTPEFSQSDTTLAYVKGNDPSKTETVKQHDASTNFSPSYFRDETLKSAMQKLPIQYNEYHNQLPANPHQQISFATNQSQPMQYSEYYSWLPPVPLQQTSFATSQGHQSCYHHQQKIPYGLTLDSPHFQRPSFQTSHSLPQGFSSFPSHMLDNLPRVRIHDEIPKKNINNEHPNGYPIRMNKSYMEERNLKLYIFPGTFYDTPNGVLVEIKNGSNYEIGVANDNSEDCDVDLYVDMELVYRLRLNAYHRSKLDGPENHTKKFLFLRAFDAPLEANIHNKHERNGQIKAVFKPKVVSPADERKRAWSADAAASCSQFLDQALGNIMGPSVQGITSPPPADERYRSANFCSGATALQGNQREKLQQLAEYMRVDENRLVILQLRLVASIDDQSRPSTAEPIMPLITKMPPPLPF